MNKFTVTLDGQPFIVEIEGVTALGRRLTVIVNGETLTLNLPDPEATLEAIEWMVVNGRPYEFVSDPDLHWLRASGGLHRLEVRDMAAGTVRPHSGDGRVKAPIPGLIARVLVAAGETVEAGAPVIVLEAMKMENEIRAPFSGRVVAIHVTPGQSVIRNEVLVEIG